MKPDKLLELVASGVLLLVIVSLGWIMLAAYQPDWLRLPSLELEVLLVLGLFTAALVLVSVVALRQTRG
jgi:uncharacterized membrane protein (DUF485 family)